MKWHRVALQNNFQGKFRNWCTAVKYLSVTLKPSSFNSRRVTVWTVHRFCQLSVSEMTVGLSYILEPLNWLLSHYRTECSCILACRITQDAVGEFQEVLHCLIFFKDIWDELQCNHNHPSTCVVGFFLFCFCNPWKSSSTSFSPNCVLGPLQMFSLVPCLSQNPSISLFSHYCLDDKAQYAYCIYAVSECL